MEKLQHQAEPPVYFIVLPIILNQKESSRINHFAHVNHTKNHKCLGKLLCINGAGIQYRWLEITASGKSYEKMNELASKVAVGSEGVYTIPFGNGAERMLNNINVGTHIYVILI